MSLPKDRTPSMILDLSESTAQNTATIEKMPTVTPNSERKVLSLSDLMEKKAKEALSAINGALRNQPHNYPQLFHEFFHKTSEL